MAICLIFSPTSSQIHPLQVENCDSNSRLVVDEDDNGKFRLERFNYNTNNVDFIINIEHLITINNTSNI